MSETKNVIAALVKAQLKIKGPKKTGVNPMFKNRYATYDDIMSCVRTPLAEEGLTPFHTAEEREGKWVHVTRILHVSGEFLQSEFPMSIEKMTSQGAASANTYAKRQGMCNILGLAGDEDDDGNEATKMNQETHRAVISPAQREAIEEYIGEDAALADRVLKAYKVKSLADLETKHFTSVLNGVKKLKTVVNA